MLLGAPVSLEASVSFVIYQLATSFGLGHLTGACWLRVRRLLGKGAGWLRKVREGNLLVCIGFQFDSGLVYRLL